MNPKAYTYSWTNDNATSFILSALLVAIYSNGATILSNTKRQSKGNIAPMESEKKLEILQEVFDVPWDDVDEPMDESLRRFTQAVVTDGLAAWYDDDVFIDTLMDNFPDDHPLWQFIRLE